jgi:pyruvate kinase
MVANLRRAERELGRGCRILMDLAGPKLRTGAIDPASQTLRWKPQRNRSGEVIIPARIWLTAAEQPRPPGGPADACLHVPAEWIRRARRGERLRFTDMRGKRRILELGSAAAGGRWASAGQTAYVREGRALRLTTAASARRGRRATRLDAVPRAASPDQHYLTLKAGDALLLTRAPIPGQPAVVDERGCPVSPATISCTLGEAFADVRPQERIWFDDGRIGGVIEAVTNDGVRVRITSARSAGEKLRADKGINLPDSRLRMPAMTDKDIADLNFVAQHADLVGLSFVRTPGDVRELQTHLARLGAAQLSIVLKIETTTAFEHLPALLLAAMRAERVGVMIARGDLAVECGYERLAEVQEEVLWFCEAAHVPVIWATQVLESLAKKGVPSRAEITDAAMGERAECVMLNKGPHLVDAVRVLQDILQRMEAHQSKKSARLRRLRLSAIAASA